MRRERNIVGPAARTPSLRLPQSLLKGPTERRQLPVARHVVELEARVPWVHVEVDAERAPGGEHPRGQVLGGDARAVEVADETFGREADGAPGAVDLIGPARRRASPPDAAPWVEPAVLNEGGQVLPERDEFVGRRPGGGPCAEADRSVAELRHGGGVGLGRQVLDAVGLHPVFPVLRLESPVERGDDVLHYLRRARDHSGAVLACRADRFDGTRLHVERDLAWVPERDVDASVLAMRARADERRDDGGRRAARRRRDESVVVEGDPLPFAGKGAWRPPAA